MASSKPTARQPAPGAFTPEQIRAGSRARVKSGVKTPEEVLSAFSQVPLKCGDIVLNPFNLANLMLLERIESPLVEERIEGVEVEITAFDMGCAVFVLTRPETESLDLLGQGRAIFDRAVYAFAARIPAPELSALGLKLRLLFLQATATVVAGADGQKKTTSSPPSPTGSAGG